MQLRFTLFAVINLREDFHLQECAHAGRRQKPPPCERGLGRLAHRWLGGLGRICYLPGLITQARVLQQLG